MLKLSVIVPVYNEEGTVRKLLERLEGLRLNKQLIIVDDGSTDGTAEHIRAFNHKKNHETIFLKENQGKGGAVFSALSKIEGEYVVFQDADLEYNPNDLINLMEFATKHDAPVIYGSRFMRNAQYPYVLLKVFHFLINRFVNLLYDTRLTP